MFDEVMMTKERLREIVGTPSHRMAGKSIDLIDDICRKYIAASPYISQTSKRAASEMIDIEQA